jgi:hypothetical protein
MDIRRAVDTDEMQRHGSEDRSMPLPERFAQGV